MALTLVSGCHAEMDVAEPVTWTATQIPLLESLSLQSLSDPPADPGNRWGDDPAAAALGENLFFDDSLTGTRISCSSGHVPELGFTDGRPTSKGLGVVRRNAPTLLDVAYRRWLFWDGRSNSLWSQVLETLESPTEMGGLEGSPL
jgi:cytochrome c peroxidase